MAYDRELTWIPACQETGVIEDSMGLRIYVMIHGKKFSTFLGTTRKVSLTSVVIIYYLEIFLEGVFVNRLTFREWRFEKIEFCPIEFLLQAAIQI